jgi:hypothetical protein
VVGSSRFSWSLRSVSVAGNGLSAGQRTVHPQFSDGTAMETLISFWFIWFIWFVLFIWFFRLVWFNKINETNQTK